MSERFVCPPDHKHGENATCYTGHRCGCADCRGHMRDRTFYTRHMVAAGRMVTQTPVDATGSRRRLQALMALGWSQSQLAMRLGTQQQSLSKLIRFQELVMPSTAAKVTELYEQLWDQHPVPASKGELISVRRSVNYARRHGFQPPMAWDDPDADEQPNVGVPVDVDHAIVALAVDGARPRMRPAEREAAVRVLNGRGLTDPAIAEVLGCSPFTVLRIRQRTGMPERFNQINGRPGYRGKDAA